MAMERQRYKPLSQGNRIINPYFLGIISLSSQTKRPKLFLNNNLGRKKRGNYNIFCHLRPSSQFTFLGQMNRAKRQSRAVKYTQRVGLHQAASLDPRCLYRRIGEQWSGKGWPINLAAEDYLVRVNLDVFSGLVLCFCY